ncbi:hypothetical protein, partial [Xanthomonas sp. SHU 308]|uniref:hypothetical protein n=1 Tax=Xanthomonas sp. SHU 308 TaxID=1591201 RepID=UPI001E4CC428
MAHVAPNARPGMAGPVVPALAMPRHGRLRSHLAQRTSESKEAMRLRTAGSRMAERPAMEGRAGLSGAGDVTPRGRGREPSAAAPVPLPAAPRAPAAAVR